MGRKMLCMRLHTAPCMHGPDSCCQMNLNKVEFLIGESHTLLLSSTC
jgi:hypothetical protein